MSRAIEIYPLQKCIARDLENIKSDPHNAEVMQRYYNARVAEGISIARTYKCLNTLKILSRMFGKPFETATKDEIVELVARFERKDLSDWTKRDYKVVLKHFFKWLRNCEDVAPPEVRWIKKGHPPENRFPILPKDLLTSDEKLAMMKATLNPRDRALIEVCSESGRRVGEILTLHIRDVEFDEIGAKLFVNGKVGQDFARIISSAPALAIWLDNHPLRDDADAPVWIGLGKSNHLKQLSQAAAASLLKNVAKRAGIPKRRMHFYLFRHTRIDETQGVLTESQQCMMFGWRFGSRMPATYMKRYGKHIDDAQAIMNGMRPPKKETVTPIRPMQCRRCGLQNSPASKFCNRCGMVLGAENAIKIDESKRMVEELLNAIANDPTKLQKLRALLPSRV